jgi:hypothetical protein
MKTQANGIVINGVPCTNGNDGEAGYSTPARIETIIQWYPVSEIPKCNVHAGGIEMVAVLIAHKGELVTPGLYQDGKFFLFGYDIECPHVTHWAYFPKHPEKE